VAAVFREEAGRLAATLVGIFGNFELAEEVVQDALLAALERWPAEGIPEKPGAWLLTVARRRAIDVVRRDARYRDKLAQLAEPAAAEPDDRLRLIFTCCHPALSEEAQVALTLRTVCGLSVAEIASAFLTSESTVAQRLVRARQRIVAAGIPYRLPSSDDLEERLNAVLAVLYLLFNQGYLTHGGQYDLTSDAEWLTSLLARLMPDEPEVLGLLALIRLHRARVSGRFDAQGSIVLLRDQDRSRWDRKAIAAAGELLAQAARLGRTGPYQLQSAIVACHAEAPSWEETDWRQIVLLYDALLALAPSPVVRLNRAVALSQVHGPAVALAEVDALGESLSRYHLYHATRAELLRELGRAADARLADEQALQLASNPAERAVLSRRLTP